MTAQPSLFIVRNYSGRTGRNSNGTPGTTTYSYRISAFNDAGETLACTSVATTTGNATLNATNYNALAWTATSGATGWQCLG